MKKWIVAIIVFLVAAFIFLNFILPSPGTIAINKNIKASSDGIYRVIAEQQTWNKLFPGEFTVTKKLLNTVHISVTVENKTSQGYILLVPLSNDSCTIHWETGNTYPRGLVNRIQNLMSSNHLKKKLVFAIDSLGSFCSNTINTYGIQVIQRSTTDTFLITTKFNTVSYPTNQEIYSHIDELKKFAASKNAKQAGYPMLNISTTDSLSFRCMVGLPIDQIIEANYNSPIAFVRMVPGQFLTAEVDGGPYTIKKARRMMQLYFQDYKRTAMAIPFEYLVTDRLTEKDTTKWITKLYAPVY